MPSRADLIARLRRRGSLQHDATEAALQAAPRASFCDEPLKDFSFLDIPWPTSDGGFSLSPRLSTLLAEAIDCRPGVRVYLGPGAHPLLTALLARVGASLVFRTGHPVDVALLIDADLDIEDAVRPCIADGGILWRVRVDAGGESIVRYVRTPGQWVRMDMTRLRRDPGGPAEAWTLGGVLAVEGMLRRAWEGRRERPEDAAFAHAVEHAWDPRVPSDAVATARQLLARKFYHLGVIHQGLWDEQGAAWLYEASLAALPTAEAHVELGRMKANDGNNEAAMSHRRQALEIDPGYRNAYLDIGRYWLEDGKAGRALAWLELAKTARRGTGRHLAHTNAGRAWMTLGRRENACREFRAALLLDPDFEPAQRLLEMAGG